jgi:hypothetical protein
MEMCTYGREGGENPGWVYDVDQMNRWKYVETTGKK